MENIKQNVKIKYILYVQGVNDRSRMDNVEYKMEILELNGIICF